MAGTEHQRRRFLTRHDVEDAAAAGRPVVLGARDVLTDEARQRAMDLGVRVEREGGPGAPGGTPTSPRPAERAERAEAPDEQLRQAVRRAVVAELGHEPAGLDAALDRVMARRR